MKDIGFGNDNSKALFVGKRPKSLQKKIFPHRTLHKNGGIQSASFNKPYFPS
jgi:hypothetical protein